MSTTDRQCPNGHPMDAAASFCTQCGATTTGISGTPVCANGHQLAADDAFCPWCGTQPRAAAVPASVGAFPPPPPGFTMAGPHGTPAPPPPQYAPAYLYVQPQTTNGLAIASLVVSVVPICGVNAIVALVLGIIALNQIKAKGQAGRGLAIAGIVVSAVQLALGLAYLVVILVVAAHGGSSSSSTSAAVMHASDWDRSMRLALQSLVWAAHG